MQVVGTITEQVARLLNKPDLAGCCIYFGETNHIHMESSHPEAYAKYGSRIPEILSQADYVRTNEKDNSIEYVKEFLIDGEFVKIAVRAAKSDRYFARTLYVLNKGRAERFIKSGKLLPLHD